MLRTESALVDEFWFDILCAFHRQERRRLPRGEIAHGGDFRGGEPRLAKRFRGIAENFPGLTPVAWSERL